MSVQDQKPKWALHFKIDDGTWAKLTAESLKNHVSPLEVAIGRGILDQDSFLSWDRDTSKTPVLKIDFFNSPQPMELFQKFDYSQCRQKGCMPVTEWGGNTYWAKLSSELTGFEKEGSQPFWFLAPWAGLKKWFEAWKAIALPAEPEPMPFAAFVEPPQVEIPQNNRPAEIILGNEDQTFEPVVAQIPLEPHEVSESKSFTGTELRVLPRIAHEEPSEESFKNSSEGKKPLRPEASANAVDPKVFAPRPDSVITSISKVVEAPTGLNPFNPEVTSAIDFSSLLGVPKPPSPLTKSDMTPLPPTPGEEPLTSPGVPITKPINKDAIPTIPLDQFESRMRLATTQDNLAETFMGAWQNYFQQIMILLFKNNELCVWWHNRQFTGPLDRGKIIPLDTPSAFKIVADTGQPYHGYVSHGTVNDQFFQMATAGIYPEHLTIVPVTSGEHVVAMLLGICSQEIAKKIVLLKLQENAKSFSNSLSRISTTIKKTA